jgi:hypothetical protein
MAAFPFTNGIDICKFDETYSVVTLKNGDQHKGLVIIDTSEENQWVIVLIDDARIWVDFEEIESLRWPTSGLVRDHFYDAPGKMHHVRELHELRN